MINPNPGPYAAAVHVADALVGHPGLLARIVDSSLASAPSFLHWRACLTNTALQGQQSALKERFLVASRGPACSSRQTSE